MGNTECCLWDHTRLLSVLDGGDDVTWVVEPVEDTGDVYALSLLDLVHQATYVGRHGEHTQTVESTVEHVGLDTRFVQGLGEGTYSLVGVLPIEEVHLLEGTAIGLHTSEAAHLDEYGSDTLELIPTGLILTRGLPHVAVDEAEFDFSLLHKSQKVVLGIYYLLFLSHMVGGAYSECVATVGR